MRALGSRWRKHERTWSVRGTGQRGPGWDPGELPAVWHWRRHGGFLTCTAETRILLLESLWSFHIVAGHLLWNCCVISCSSTDMRDVAIRASPAGMGVGRWPSLNDHSIPSGNDVTLPMSSEGPDGINLAWRGGGQLSRQRKQHLQGPHGEQGSVFRRLAWVRPGRKGPDAVSSGSRGGLALGMLA